MNTKNIFLSKTFWVQLLALLMLAVPAVKTWVETNPVPYLAAFAALNVVLRFVTSGAVSLLGTDGTDGSEKSPGGAQAGGTKALAVSGGMLLAGGLAGLGFFLPACSPSQMDAVKQVPIKACYVDENGNSVCYSTVDGVTATVDRRSGK